MNGVDTALQSPECVTPPKTLEVDGLNSVDAETNIQGVLSQNHLEKWRSSKITNSRMCLPIILSTDDLQPFQRKNPIYQLSKYRKIQPQKLSKTAKVTRVRERSS